MRKIIGFIMFFSILFVMICPSASATEIISETPTDIITQTPEQAEPVTIDIGLYYNSSAKQSVSITYMGNTAVVNASDVADVAEYISDGIIAVDGKEYRGSIILKKDSNGQLTVINRVNLEDYIASVVSVEMSPSFEIEALKAQAVCARTYAMKNKNKHKSYGFDLCTSVHCQAYNGISAEYDITTKAAVETEGLYMTYDGQVIDAVYSATSGGWTEDVKNVWGSDIPYLKPAEDIYESKEVYGSSWTKELTVEKATEIMNSKDYDIGTVTDITVEEQTERGVVTKLKVTGTKGDKVFTRENCRIIFGNVTLSQAFSVSPVSKETKNPSPLYTYDGKKITGKMNVLTKDGVSKMSLDTVVLQGDVKRDYTSVVSGPVTAFVFEGRGYGHLVGLSQNGANGMAKAGFTFDEILKHYYKGIELNWI